MRPLSSVVSKPSSSSVLRSGRSAGFPYEEGTSPAPFWYPVLDVYSRAASKVPGCVPAAPYAPRSRRSPSTRGSSGTRSFQNDSSLKTHDALSFG